MIAVTGEALIDLVTDHDGRIAARTGGGPFTTARAIGRLGLALVFLGRLSVDRFGRQLQASLDADGVTLALPGLTDAPTTLAVVDLDPAGSPRFRFYTDGTSAAALDYPALAAALPGGLTALHAGSLGLVMEPIATAIDRVVGSDLPPGALLMIDPNCRPEAIGDRQAYLARLAYLAPDVPAPAAATALLGQGPALVLMTDGPRPARALLRDGELTAEVPEVQVVDTVGAGDAFGGAFLAWWCGNGLTRADLERHDLVREALQAAAEAASLACTRPGAEPPWLAELRDRPGWRSGFGAPR
jgi:fructokinase